MARGYRPVDPAIREAVRAAVRGAAADANRGSIVKAFQGRGVSNATLYNWIAKDMELSATEIVAERTPYIPKSIATIASTSAVPLDSSRNYYDVLDRSLRDCDLAIAMSKADDGRIRNPKLLLLALAEIRKTVQALAGMHDERALHTFLIALTDAVKPEGQEVWERVAGRMRAINQAHGYF